ncbi:hypothetical protein HDU87_002055 [Geranomyces variabilis]|uniref:GH18 domain-containing protein n=1 Tax=Geranomyces variabilis TaxID=109894 RepID=A0AAD5XNM7_9FUNG|nr:hypothetical protein HDU87_002055 [Geranomyces variabilis]
MIYCTSLLHQALGVALANDETVTPHLLRRQIEEEAPYLMDQEWLEQQAIGAKARQFYADSSKKQDAARPKFNNMGGFDQLKRRGVTDLPSLLSSPRYQATNGQRQCTTETSVENVAELIELEVVETVCIKPYVDSNGEVYFGENDGVNFSLKFCIEIGFGPLLRSFGMEPPCFGIQVTWWTGRGMVDLDIVANVFMLEFVIKLSFKVYEPRPAFCRGFQRCMKPYCLGNSYMEMNINLHLLFIQKEISSSKLLLPQCNPNDAPSTPKPAFQGKPLEAYFPNWKIYDNPAQPHGLRIGAEKRAISHWNFAFVTTSYSRETQSWYLDTTDSWGDFALCVDMPNCDNFENNCMPVDPALMCSPGVIALAPYFGAKSASGGCPVKANPDSASDDCFGVNKYAVPGILNKVLCHTTLSKQNGALRLGDNGVYYICGAIGYLFNQAVLPDATQLILSIGGWSDSSLWSIATRPENINDFTTSIESWVSALGWDGVDIDWELPGMEHGGQMVPAAIGGSNIQSGATVDNTQYCPTNTSCNVDRTRDVAQYVDLLAKLKTKLAHHKASISIAAPVGDGDIDRLGPSLQTMCASITYMNLMAYDIAGTWSTVANHQAPLYDYTPPAIGKSSSINNSVSMYLAYGCPANKIVVGMPWYSRSVDGVTMDVDVYDHGRTQDELFLFPGLYQPFATHKSPDLMPLFKDIYPNIGPGFYNWTEVWDPYAHASYYWLESTQTFASIDSVRSVINKAKWVNQLGLLGAMGWMAGDDAPNYPLINATRNALDSGSTDREPILPPPGYYTPPAPVPGPTFNYPVITINSNGILAQYRNPAAATTLTDPRAVQSDCNGTTTISATGTVNANVDGIYLMEYGQVPSTGDTVTYSRRYAEIRTLPALVIVSATETFDTVVVTFSSFVRAQQPAAVIRDYHNWDFLTGTMGSTSFQLRGLLNGVAQATSPFTLTSVTVKDSDPTLGFPVSWTLNIANSSPIRYDLGIAPGASCFDMLYPYAACNATEIVRSRSIAFAANDLGPQTVQSYRLSVLFSSTVSSRTDANAAATDPSSSPLVPSSFTVNLVQGVLVVMTQKAANTVSACQAGGAPIGVASVVARTTGLEWELSLNLLDSAYNDGDRLVIGITTVYSTVAPKGAIPCALSVVSLKKGYCCDPNKQQTPPVCSRVGNSANCQQSVNGGVYNPTSCSCSQTSTTTTSTSTTSTTTTSSSTFTSTLTNPTVTPTSFPVTVTIPVPIPPGFTTIPWPPIPPPPVKTTDIPTWITTVTPALTTTMHVTYTPPNIVPIPVTSTTGSTTTSTSSTFTSTFTNPTVNPSSFPVIVTIPVPIPPGFTVITWPPFPPLASTTTDISTVITSVTPVLTTTLHVTYTPANVVPIVSSTAASSPSIPPATGVPPATTPKATTPAAVPTSVAIGGTTVPPVAGSAGGSTVTTSVVIAGSSSGSSAGSSARSSQGGTSSAITSAFASTTSGIQASTTVRSATSSFGLSTVVSSMPPATPSVSESSGVTTPSLTTRLGTSSGITSAFATISSGIQALTTVRPTTASGSLNVSSSTGISGSSIISPSTTVVASQTSSLPTGPTAAPAVCTTCTGTVIGAWCGPPAATLINVNAVFAWTSDDGTMASVPTLGQKGLQLVPATSGGSYWYTNFGTGACTSAGSANGLQIAMTAPAGSTFQIALRFKTDINCTISGPALVLSSAAYATFDGVTPRNITIPFADFVGVDATKLVAVSLQTFSITNQTYSLSCISLAAGIKASVPMIPQTSVTSVSPSQTPVSLACATCGGTVVMKWCGATAVTTTNALGALINDDGTMQKQSVGPAGTLQLMPKLDGTSYWYTLFGTGACTSAGTATGIQIIATGPAGSTFQIALRFKTNAACTIAGPTVTVTSSTYATFDGRTPQNISIPFSDFAGLDTTKLASLSLQAFSIGNQTYSLSCISLANVTEASAPVTATANLATTSAPSVITTPVPAPCATCGGSVIATWCGATALTTSNVVGALINDDGTMQKQSIGPAGTLQLVPKLDGTSYWYTRFGTGACTSAGTASGLQIIISAPAGSSFLIVLRTRTDATCTVSVAAAVNSGTYAKFDGATSQTLSIPFTDFAGADISKLDAVSLQTFSAGNQTYSLSCVSLAMLAAPCKICTGTVVASWCAATAPISTVNALGGYTSDDGSMQRQALGAGGVLSLLPAVSGSYWYSVFGTGACYSAGTTVSGLQIIISAPAGSTFQIALRYKTDAACTTTGPLLTVDAASYAKFDGVTPRTLSIPFADFRGLDPTRIVSVSLQGFSATQQAYNVSCVSLAQVTTAPNCLACPPLAILDYCSSPLVNINALGGAASDDGTMAKPPALNGSAIALVPQAGSYWYTNIGCQNVSSYNYLTLAMTIPAGALVTIEVQTAAAATGCPAGGAVNRGSVSSAAYASSTNGAAQNVTIPFAALRASNAALDLTRVTALSFTGFSRTGASYQIACASWKVLPAP